MCHGNAPDFYLASSEGYALEEPRAAWRIRRLRGDHRDDYLLIRVAPPLIGENYDIPVWEFDTVVVAPRHRGFSLFPITEWPAFVHVAYPMVERPEQRQEIHDTELRLIAWADSIGPRRRRAGRRCRLRGVFLAAAGNITQEALAGQPNLTSAFDYGDTHRPSCWSQLCRRVSAPASTCPEAQYGA